MIDVVVARSDQPIATREDLNDSSLTSGDWLKEYPVDDKIEFDSRITTCDVRNQWFHPTPIGKFGWWIISVAIPR